MQVGIAVEQRRQPAEVAAAVGQVDGDELRARVPLDARARGYPPWHHAAARRAFTRQIQPFISPSLALSIGSYIQASSATWMLTGMQVGAALEQGIHRRIIDVDAEGGRARAEAAALVHQFADAARSGGVAALELGERGLGETSEMGIVEIAPRYPPAEGLPPALDLQDPDHAGRQGALSGDRRPYP